MPAQNTSIHPSVEMVDAACHAQCLNGACAARKPRCGLYFTYCAGVFRVAETKTRYLLTIVAVEPIALSAPLEPLVLVCRTLSDYQP